MGRPQTTSDSSSSSSSAAADARRRKFPLVVSPQYSNLIQFSFCASGICVCYWYYGVVQENLLTNSGLGATFMLVIQTVTNVLVAQVWQWVEQSVGEGKDSSSLSKTQPQPPGKQQSSLHHSLLVVTSACYVFAMVCSNESLSFVTYPTAVLAKSCKLIPTMIMGRLVEKRKYSTAQWLSTVLISGGIALFHLSRISKSATIKDNHGEEKEKEDVDESWKGMALLLTSLCMDGLMASCQGMLKWEDSTGKRRAPTAVETMFFVNLYALLFLLPIAIISGQWETGIHILWDHPTLLNSINKLNGVVALGQVFIFLTLTWYSSLVCTTITTTRKFFTILFSVFWFGHKFANLQWVSVLLVFGGLYLSTFAKGTGGGGKPPVASNTAHSSSNDVVEDHQNHHGKIV